MGLPLIPSINVKTNCPPSNKGNGKEFKTAKLIEINAAKSNIPVPPCSDN